MAKIEVEPKELLDALSSYLGTEDVRVNVAALRKFDWWPFDDDGDEYETVWEEVNHNWILVRDAMLSIVVLLEKVVVGGIALSNQQKHKMAVAMLDRMIKLPFFLEPFDNIVLDMLVKFCVDFWKKINWGVTEEEALKRIDVTVNSDGTMVFREIGG